MTITKDGVIVAISIIYFIGWLFVIFMKYKNRFLSLYVHISTGCNAAQ